MENYLLIATNIKKIDGGPLWINDNFLPFRRTIIIIIIIIYCSLPPGPPAVLNRHRKEN